MARVRLDRPTTAREAGETRRDDAIDKALNKAAPSWVRDGVLLRGANNAGLTFAASDIVAIDHTLGRQPVVWLVVRDFGANPHELIETASNDKQLTLTSAVDCTVYLWVA